MGTGVGKYDAFNWKKRPSDHPGFEFYVPIGPV